MLVVLMVLITRCRSRLVLITSRPSYLRGGGQFTQSGATLLGGAALTSSIVTSSGAANAGKAATSPANRSAIATACFMMASSKHLIPSRQNIASAGRCAELLIRWLIPAHRRFLRPAKGLAFSRKVSR